MQTKDLRSYAVSQGHKIIGQTNEQLKQKVNLPEIGELVHVQKTKSQSIISTYLGCFQCKKTKKFYAKLETEFGKKYIKQLQKIKRNGN